MWKRISKYYPPWLEIVPLIMVFFTFFYLVFYYGKLPDTIPTHFNASGVPDSWEHKGSIIVLPVLSFLIYSMDFLINYFLIMKPEDPSKAINLSDKRKALLGQERLEKIRTLTARSLFITNTLVSILFAFIVAGTIEVALGKQAGLGWGLWVVLGLLLAVNVWMIIKLTLLSKIPKN